jgi:hypothetical protein
LFIKTFYSKDTILYAGTNSGIYKTTNNGLNWALYGLSATAINAIIIQNNNLLIGTDNGILITTNNGLSWTPWLLSGKSIKGFYIFQNKIYSGTNSGVYNSSDNGFTWNQIGLSSYSVNSFANFSDTLVCSSSYGVFVSSNGGNNWIWLGLQYLGGTRSILVFNNNIYACGITGSSGEVSGCVWRRIASTQSGIRNISGEIVSNYFLYQNYPNPFNPSTKIKFDIQNRSPIGALGDDRVVLKIYDILGKEVAVLVNEQLQPGSYEVTFDGSNLSSGIYFYRLRAGEYVETKRMVLIK